jgi:hypothetical protein
VIPNVIEASKKKGYTVFEQDHKPFNLNIIAVRANDATPNVFNDRLHICWKYKGKWTDFNFPVTCDPGMYWLNNPLSKLGTAIVKPGQYKGLWKTGLHRGKYFALVQKKEVTVIRDYNKDSVVDFSEVEESGMFGINHHRANANKESVRVDKWSAGCIVNPNPQVFEIEMEIFRQSANIWGNSFTFTLLKESEL